MTSHPVDSEASSPPLCRMNTLHKPGVLQSPPHDCPLCARLAAFRSVNRRQFPDRFNGPVSGFGPLAAPILIVGLAPGLRGANFTGRPFTGDWAGDLLYETLLKYDLAQGNYQERADDTLELMHCRVVNAVRCVPPKNRPEVEEIRNCRSFLESEMRAMKNLRIILVLGRIAHQSVCDVLGLRRSHYPFLHGANHLVHSLSEHGLKALEGVQSDEKGRTKDLVLLMSYHCSRYNTSTRRLTQQMFEKVVVQARMFAGLQGPQGS